MDPPSKRYEGKPAVFSSVRGDALFPFGGRMLLRCFFSPSLAAGVLLGAISGVPRSGEPHVDGHGAYAIHAGEINATFPYSQSHLSIDRMQ